MDIEKSQRLIKFANLIKDTVDYVEISGYLLQSKVLTLTDHQKLNDCIQQRGNSYAMEDLLHILGLRRGGFNAFMEALRQNDYNWIADQMDPQKLDCEDTSSSSKGIFPAIGFKKRKSRTSERLSSETIFTSYRQNMPMDLGTLRPRSSRVASQEIPSRTKFLEYPAKFISASLDNLKLDEGNGSKKVQSSQMDITDSTSGFTETQPQFDEGSGVKRSVILYNVPEPESLPVGGTLPPVTSDVKIISKIAQQLEFPDEHLKGLKAVRMGRITKTDKPSSGARPLKVKFKSQEARDRFVSLMQNQARDVLAQDEILADVQVFPYDKNRKASLKSGKSHWWSHNRFLSLKRNKSSKNKNKETAA